MMKFEKMDNGTLRCTLTQEDLALNGVELDDFFSNTQNAREFLEKLIRMAEDEVGYKANGNMMSIQAAIMPDNKIVLTFSESQVSNSEIIEHLKSMISSSKDGTNKEHDKDVKEGILNELGSRIGAKGKKSKGKNGKLDEKTAKTEAKREARSVENDYDYLVTFNVFPRVLDFCHVLPKNKDSVSRLYYLEREKSYYLHADLNKSSRKYIYEFVAASMEYAQSIEKNSSKGSFLEEHGKIICKERALETLAKI